MTAWVRQQTKASSTPDRRNGYAVALLTVAVTVVLALVLREYLSRSIFILFAAPVAMTSWYAGRKPALLAAFASLLAADVIFVDRIYWIVPRDSRDLVAIAIYIAVALIIVHLSGFVADARDELAHLNDSLRGSVTAQLAEAQSLARLGSWEWDIGKDYIKWSDEMHRIYGIEPGSGEIDFERYQSFLHPDDRMISQQAVEESLKTGEPFTFHHRIIRSDGEVRTLHARGKVISDSSGKPIRMIGTGQDITEARRAEAA
ncbi:MAG TPA: PAS domain-containing protein, partial [Gemmatimonadaceae bacterium]|nr:PAS domain-containing protein [Gemmatimonadaceae bacterium]